MATLLSKEAVSIKQHVEVEAAALATHVSSEIGNVQKTMSLRHNREAEEYLQQRILKSLKYERMNARRNMIADAHVKTFEWIFNHHRRVCNPLMVKNSFQFILIFPLIEILSRLFCIVYL
jgi:hypothetical protein